MKYPKIIYIQTEKERDNTEYLLAWETAEEANDGKIAVYELKEVKTKETKTIIK
jgi:hypothetical protein